MCYIQAWLDSEDKLPLYLSLFLSFSNLLSILASFFFKFLFIYF